ncbi:MAG: GTP cyclohydrolase MptA [Methermicoccaceae archaeon]
MPTKIPTRELPDVQASHPDIPINLTRVGVSSLKKLVEVAREGKRPIILISKFDIFVDLPSSLKGANLSRNSEVINEVLEEALNAPVYEIEDLCDAVANKLLERHEYASRAEVRMVSEYNVKRTTPSTKTECQEMVEIFAEAVAMRSPKERTIKMVGAEVVGMTACPCAQDIMKDKALHELRELGIPEKKIWTFLKKMPMPTHNQRGRGRIIIQVHNNEDVPLIKIIHIIEESMSSRVYETLKRDDEAMVVYHAHKNPKFVEDCVRTMAQKVLEEFSNLSDDAVVSIIQINEESIHNHNAFAERVATIGELRDELSWKRV